VCEWVKARRPEVSSFGRRPTAGTRLALGCSDSHPDPTLYQVREGGTKGSGSARSFELSTADVGEARPSEFQFFPPPQDIAPPTEPYVTHRWIFLHVTAESHSLRVSCTRSWPRDCAINQLSVMLLRVTTICDVHRTAVCDDVDRTYRSTVVILCR
jgi:hypothetical protein